MKGNNPIETESYLFGINSTNLVKPRAPVTPQINNLDNVVFFEKSKVQIPEPLVIKKNQRPNW